jgi:cyclopropane fatty-acyl-phospholipid synthase-like methyltransferase
MKDIKDFFNKASLVRDDDFSSNAIIDYEQTVRAQTVFSLLELTGHEQVLDVGCGDGRDLISIGPNCKKTIGLDSSKDMVFKAIIRVKQANITNTEVQVETL